MASHLPASRESLCSPCYSLTVEAALDRVAIDTRCHSDRATKRPIERRGAAEAAGVRHLLDAASRLLERSFGASDSRGEEQLCERAAGFLRQQMRQAPRRQSDRRRDVLEPEPRIAGAPVDDPQGLGDAQIGWRA